MTYIEVHLICSILAWYLGVWLTTTVDGEDVTIKDYIILFPMALLLGPIALILVSGVTLASLNEMPDSVKEKLSWLNRVVHPKK